MVRLIAFTLLGLLLAAVFNIHQVQNFWWYPVLISALLSIGLYASTFGINLTEARAHFKLILSAVTIGVILKAAIIGGSLALLFGDPFFLILGIIVAQIDPLSVSALLKGQRLSAKAKTILASWASFDDPMTVILALYTPVFLAQFTKLQLAAGNLNDGIVAYITGVGFNILLAAAVFGLWLLCRRAKAQKTRLASEAFLLLAAFALAITNFLMLAIAFIGLFLRPPIENYIDTAIKIALCLATILLGLLLVDGINIVGGLALGFAAYFSQVIVGFLLTRGLAKKDRWHIAFAQQNGITAIILALLFEPIHPGTVAIVAPAIIVVNSLHYTINKIIDRFVLQEYTKTHAKA